MGGRLPDEIEARLIKAPLWMVIGPEAIREVPRKDSNRALNRKGMKYFMGDVRKIRNQFN